MAWIDKCARSVSWTEALLKFSLYSFDQLEMIKQVSFFIPPTLHWTFRFWEIAHFYWFNRISWCALRCSSLRSLTTTCSHTSRTWIPLHPLLLVVRHLSPCGTCQTCVTISCSTCRAWDIPWEGQSCETNVIQPHQWERQRRLRQLLCWQEIPQEIPRPMTSQSFRKVTRLAHDWISRVCRHSGRVQSSRHETSLRSRRNTGERRRESESGDRGRRCRRERKRPAFLPLLRLFLLPYPFPVYACNAG